MDPWGYDSFAACTQKFSVDEYAAYLRTLDTAGTCVGFFGDSHLRTVISPDATVYAPFGVRPHIAYIPGATVLGFGRRKSSLEHFAKIKLYAEQARPYAVVLKFGQVDMDLGLYHKLLVKREQLDIMEHIETLVTCYLESLRFLRKLTKVFVLPLNLPTLRDQQVCAQYTARIITENISDAARLDAMLAALPRLLPGYSLRVKLTAAFNAALAARVADICNFIDISELFLEDGEVRARFLTNDHHYAVTDADKAAATRMILRAVAGAELLRDTGDRMGES